MSISNNNKTKKYEISNYVSDDGDSIYAVPTKDLPAGQIYYSLEALDDIVEKVLDRRFGPCKKNTGQI